MAETMSIEEIIEYMIGTYGDDLVVDHNWGERGIFYNPGHRLPKGVYLLTFKERDGPNDSASQVDRDGVYRLNLGLSKPEFIELFETIPSRFSAGNIINTGHNFTELDQIMPHPVYGWTSWIGVLNPSHATFERLKPLLENAVSRAAKKFAKRLKTAP